MAHQSVGNIFPVKLNAIIARYLFVWAAGGLNQEALRIATLQKPATLTWNEQGVVMQSEYGDARVPWADFRKAREDQRMILLYESDRLYRLIPKRCLSAAQLADIQSCLEAVPPG